jgi:HIRAN domain
VRSAVTVDVVFEERYWYPDDGAIVWLSGYTLVDEAGRYLARDAPQLAARGLRVTGVAGAARHHAEALRSDAVAPGRSLELRRDPDNEHDPNAIAVHAAGGEQVGWVPRELAAELAPQLDAGAVWSSLSLRESRPSPRDPRAGLTMLLARAPAIELRVRPRGLPGAAG